MRPAVCLALGLFFLSLPGFAAPPAPRAPAPDPPGALKAPDASSTKTAAHKTQAPDQEWTFHKTPDGLHPDGNEQALLWLLNRARSDPHAEGQWLADTGDPDVEAAMDYFEVDRDLLRQEFDALPARPPAAFDVRLWSASLAHTEYLIADPAAAYSPHDGQLARVDEAGFDYTAWSGIVYSYAEGIVYAHAGFNIDWGPSDDDSGMQPGRGHRVALMDLNTALDRGLTNAGLAVVPESDPESEVGPLVVAGNFCQADPYSQNVFDRFLVGTVWEDENNNAMYDPGEGVSGVSVTPDHGAYYAVTGAAGGFAVPMEAAGDYVLVFSGGPLPRDIRRAAAVGTASVLMDFRLDLAAGDVNLDGRVDVADLVAALRTLAGLPGAAAAVGPETPAYILQALAGLR